MLITNKSITDTLVRGLQASFLNQSHCEITLLCQGEKIKCHRHVLVLHSSHFNDLFKNEDNFPSVIAIVNMKANHLRAMIEYMYYGKIKIENDEMETIRKCAEDLGIDALVSFVSEYIRKSHNTSISSNKDSKDLKITTNGIDGDSLMKKKKVKEEEEKKRKKSEEEELNKEADDESMTKKKKLNEEEEKKRKKAEDEERQKQAEEEKRKAEAEAKRKEEERKAEERRKAEEEQKRKAREEEKRKAREEEQKRKAREDEEEEKRKAREEEKRKAQGEEEKRKAREEEERRRKEQEEEEERRKKAEEEEKKAKLSEEAHKCNMCNKVYKDNVEHKKVFDGSVQFEKKCIVPSCSKPLKFRRSLIDHLLKEHKIDVCDG